MKSYDIDEAIAFIKKEIRPETGSKIPDDDAFFDILEILADIFEDEGMMDIDFSDNEDDDLENEAVNLRVASRAAREYTALDLSINDFLAIIRAENSYENSLLFE